MEARKVKGSRNQNNPKLTFDAVCLSITSPKQSPLVWNDQLVPKTTPHDQGATGLAKDMLLWTTSGIRLAGYAGKTNRQKPNEGDGYTPASAHSLPMRL